MLSHLHFFFFYKFVFLSPIFSLYSRRSHLGSRPGVKGASQAPSGLELLLRQSRRRARGGESCRGRPAAATSAAASSRPGVFDPGSPLT